jgi:hypothetical protein
VIFSYGQLNIVTERADIFSQELELAHRANERSLTALQRRLAADTKQFNKHIKKEYRSRRQAFLDDHESHKMNATVEQALRQVCEIEICFEITFTSVQFRRFNAFIIVF